MMGDVMKKSELQALVRECVEEYLDKQIRRYPEFYGEETVEGTWSEDETDLVDAIVSVVRTERRP